MSWIIGINQKLWRNTALFMYKTGNGHNKLDKALKKCFLGICSDVRISPIGLLISDGWLHILSDYLLNVYVGTLRITTMAYPIRIIHCLCFNIQAFIHKLFQWKPTKLSDRVHGS